MTFSMTFNSVALWILDPQINRDVIIAVVSFVVSCNISCLRSQNRTPLTTPGTHCWKAVTDTFAVYVAAMSLFRKQMKKIFRIYIKYIFSENLIFRNIIICHIFRKLTDKDFLMMMTIRWLTVRTFYVLYNALIPPDDLLCLWSTSQYLTIRPQDFLCNCGRHAVNYIGY